MRERRRPFAGWLGIVVVLGLFYMFAVRPLLQFRSPIAFVGWVALAAAGLTIVVWLEFSRGPRNGAAQPPEQERNE